MVGFILDSLLLWAGIILLDRFAVFVDERRFRRDLECNQGRESDRREVSPSSYYWQVVESETGDRDVLPLGEEHDRGALCSCEPRVDIVGAVLVVIHNSFDHREIVEEAIRAMNGEAE
jgi:hypothetical protein